MYNFYIFLNLWSITLNLLHELRRLAFLSALCTSWLVIWILINMFVLRILIYNRCWNKGIERESTSRTNQRCTTLARRHMRPWRCGSRFRKYANWRRTNPRLSERISDMAESFEHKRSSWTCHNSFSVWFLPVGMPVQTISGFNNETYSSIGILFVFSMYSQCILNRR